MEGLIPMVFRTIKRTRTRRHYEHLSPPSEAEAEAAAEPEAGAKTYNIADFYTNDHEYVIRSAHDRGFDAEVGKVQHRRNQSFHAQNLSPQQSKKLVRFRSHRLFSCTNGGL